MSAAIRRIFGMSDSASFFVKQSEQPVMARKLLALSDKENPVICYIGAAKGDKAERIQEFIKLSESIGAQARILSLFDPPSYDASTYFDGVDIIYVDGGSTRNLLALLHEWNVTPAILEAYRNGIILAGASAGVNYLFEWSITDSVKTDLRPIAGLGVLAGSICVHYDVYPMRSQAYGAFLNGNEAAFPALAIDDGVALLFENETLSEVVTLASGGALHDLGKSSIGQKLERQPAAK